MADRSTETQNEFTEQIALDGKQIRGSFDAATGQNALHLVSAWACKNRLVLEQEAVREKSNEIAAIPELLYRLNIAGCLVSIDAMGTQVNIAQQIIAQKGDYLLALKENQRELFGQAERFFTRERKHHWQREEPEGVFARPIAPFTAQSVEKGHGRIEHRRCFVVDARSLLLPEGKLEQWQSLKTVICVESKRKVSGRNSKPSVESRYYLSSLPVRPGIALQALSAVRSHWGIENSLHWVMDVGFREDASRIRKGNAPQNFATLRRIIQAVLKKDTVNKVGIATKRLKAGWDNDYLLALLTGEFEQDASLTQPEQQKRSP